MASIKLKEKKLDLVFNLKVLRELGKQWNCKGINDTLQKLDALQTLEEEVTFEALDVIFDLLYTSIKVANPKTTITKEEIENIDIHEITKITTALVEMITTNMPISTEEEIVETEKK